MELKKITDDYSVVVREADIVDLIVGQALSRHYRDRKRGRPPKPRKPPNQDRSKEYAKRRATRRKRIKAGLCAVCGGDGLTNGFKLCLCCRVKWRNYNARCAARKIFQLTPYSLSIDLD